MRLSRTDVVPVLAIIGGGAVGVLASASLLLLSPADGAPAPQVVVSPALTVELSTDTRHYVFRSVDEDSNRFVISPDGQWIAYRSHPSGEQIYVRSLSAEGMDEAASFLESLNLERIAKELSGEDPSDLTQIWVEVRPWNDLDASPVRGTEGGVQPAVSPDGRRHPVENIIALTREQASR